MADPGSTARSGRRPSAKDVARLAGVSTATVSRALNAPEQVDADTRRLVSDAVAKLRYVPHGAARALRSHRSRMVAAVVPSFGYALYARTTSAMQAVLDANGYSMVLAEHHYDLKEELRIGKPMPVAIQEAFRRAWSSIRDSHVAGLISASIIFIFGSGGIRGFALVLIIGTLLSLFSAISVTRTWMLLLAGSRLQRFLHPDPKHV